MYPYFRLALEVFAARRLPRLPPTGTHVSQHRCWPWDIDPWLELNNGRAFTLYDLGRLPLAQRIGIAAGLRAQRMGLTVAGSTIRYRRRLRAFEPFTMKSRTVGWDGRFLYIEQSMWKRDGQCASHALLRMAFVGAKGILPPPEALERLGVETVSPQLPDWVQAWIAADATRPWPPMQGV